MSGRFAALTLLVGSLVSPGSAHAELRWTGHVNSDPGVKLDPVVTDMLAATMRSLFERAPATAPQMNLHITGDSGDELGVRSTRRTIYVSWAILDNKDAPLRDEALMFILAHELGHWCVENLPDDVFERETKIDEFARQIVTSPGIGNASDELRLDALRKIATALDVVSRVTWSEYQARMGGQSHGNASTVTKCVRSVETYLRASVVREEAVKHPFFSTREKHKQAADTVNAERRRRRSRDALQRCEADLREVELDQGRGDPEAMSALRTEIESVEKVIEASYSQIDARPEDAQFRGWLSRWRDDASWILEVAAGPWLTTVGSSTAFGGSVDLVLVPPVGLKWELFWPAANDRVPNHLWAVAVSLGRASTAPQANVQTIVNSARVGICDWGISEGDLFWGFNYCLGPAYDWDSNAEHHLRFFGALQVGFGNRIDARTRLGLWLRGGVRLDDRNFVDWDAAVLLTVVRCFL